MMSIFFRKKDNISSVSWQLLKLLGLNVNYSSLYDLLHDHPDGDSLVSIVDSLNYLGVLVEYYHIPLQSYDRRDLLFPFIAHFESEEKFVLVKSIYKDNVIYADEIKNENIIGEVEFLKKWSGFALRGIVNENSGEKDFLQNRIGYLLKSLRYPLICLLVCFGIFYLLGKLSSPMVSISVLKIAGLGISIMLNMQSLEIKNSLLDSVCNIKGKNGCKKIIGSEASKITNWLTWMEIGLFYFTGTILLLFFYPQSVAFLNLLCLPFSVYLLFYQYKNNAWCVLCCIVQAVIFTEFFIDILANNFHYKYESFGLRSIILCFGLPILAWSLLKPLILKASQVPSLRYYLNTFRYDSQIFKYILATQPSYSQDKDLPVLEFGNRESNNLVMLITNPICQSCINAHQNIFSWLEKAPDIKLQIIFATSSNSAERRIANHITALYHQQGVRIAELAMTNWFNGFSDRIDEWVKLYPVISPELMDEATENQVSWCAANGLYYTPVIFINGFHLPAQYRIEDLKYIVG